MYPLPALVARFPRTFIIKDNANNGKNPSSRLCPVIAFIKEEATASINEQVIVLSMKQP